MLGRKICSTRNVPFSYQPQLFVRQFEPMFHCSVGPKYHPILMAFFESEQA